VIEAKFYLDKSKRIKGFEIKGHSNLFKKGFYKVAKIFLKKGMKDYICSAVSSASYMAVIGLNEICKKGVLFKEDTSGYMECMLKEEADEESEIILKALLNTLRKIENDYKGNLKIFLEGENGS